MSIEVKVRIEGTGKSCGDTMLKRMKDEIDPQPAYRGGPDRGRAPADRYHEARRDPDLPSHRIRYSLHVLEQSGDIRASSEGAIATERTREFFAHLNDDLEDIIRLVNSMKKP